MASEAPSAPRGEHSVKEDDGGDSEASDGFVPPPYKEGDDIERGLSCYICASRFKATTWTSLMEHLRRMHTVTHKKLNGTHLHAMARLEMRQKSNAKYKTKGGTDAKYRRIGKDPETEGRSPAEASLGGGAKGYRGNLQQPSNHVWQEMNCWVRCHADGTPVSPLECSMSKPVGQPATPNNAQGKEKHDQWATCLPDVRVSKVYLDRDHPTPSKEGGRTQPWPFKIKVEALTAPEFEQFLVERKNLKNDTLRDALRGMARVLHMLEVKGKPIRDAAAFIDPSLLVSFYLQGTHSDLFNLGITNPAHSWTRRLLEGLKLYCEFQLGVVGKELLMSDERKWSKYATAIGQLLNELRGGFSKRVGEEKAKNLMARREIDRKRINAFPSVPILKLAVHRGMLALQSISEKYRGRSELAASAQAEANAAMCGTLAFNGFFGRKKEWQSVSVDHVREQLGSGLDYIVCSDHKTVRVYGALAKWLAPGTICAARCYMLLPRRPGVKTFFCPAGKETDEVDIPSCLRTFCRRNLPAEGVVTHPTVNLLRKSYHTRLSTLSSRDDTLLDMFKAIDGHSASIAIKHYILRGPEDDAMLAKHLVHAWLGETVAWPEANALIEEPGLGVDLSERLGKVWAGEDDDNETVSGDDEEEDDELEWFEHAHCFGLAENMDIQANAEQVATGVGGIGCKRPRGMADDAATKPIVSKACQVNDPGPSSTSASSRAPASIIHKLYDKIHEDIQVNQKERPTNGPSENKRKAAGSTHAPTCSQLPRLLFGMGGLAATVSEEELELDERARKAFRTIKLPGPFKPRYYMSSDEIQWATDVHAAYMLVAGVKGDKRFFDRLYQWGVHTDMLSDECSPSGLKSLGKRLVDATALAGDALSRNEVGVGAADAEGGGGPVDKDEEEKSGEREETESKGCDAGEEGGEGVEQGVHSGAGYGQGHALAGDTASGVKVGVGAAGAEGGGDALDNDEEEKRDESEEAEGEEGDAGEEEDEGGEGEEQGMHSGGEYEGEGEEGEEEEALDELDEVGDEPMGDIICSIEGATNLAELEALVRHAKGLGGMCGDM
jgi:hypothetical protein